MRTPGEKVRISDKAERVQSVSYSHIRSLSGQCRAEGEANGAPAPGIQRVKLKKLKCCCNYMIIPIVSLLIHDAYIYFYEPCFVLNTNFYVFKCQ